MSLKVRIIVKMRKNDSCSLSLEIPAFTKTIRGLIFLQMMIMSKERVTVEIKKTYLIDLKRDTELIGLRLTNTQLRFPFLLKKGKVVAR